MKKLEHPYPTDVVFKYADPHLNKAICLHTDLKSCAVGSVTRASVKKVLKSLGKTIDCARASPEWRARYQLAKREKYEVSGMLFVFIHDDEYDKNFYDHFNGFKLENRHNKDSQ